MNENIFKPRHTCTKIQLIFFPIGIVITKTNTHAASGLNRQHTHTLTLLLYLRQNQSDEFVLILKGWIRLTFVSSFKFISKCHKVDLLKRSWKNSDGRKVFIFFVQHKDFICHCFSVYLPMVRPLAHCIHIHFCF